MSPKTKVNQLEDYLRSLILDELRKREIEISEADARQIVNNIIVEIDKLASKRIKQHFIEMAKWVIEKFSEEK
jgi:coenzyme F420-reducing hydrogenase delta subunit